MKSHGRDRDSHERLVVTEYPIGTRALLERLSVGALYTHEGGIGRGYRAWWRQLDLADPLHPRLTCPPDALRTFGHGRAAPASTEA